MGNWNISIQGIGSHHNGKPTDADQIAKLVAQTLRDAGQMVESATITYGAKETL